MLEAAQHKSSVFATLTYDDTHVPRTTGCSPDLPTLNPKDLQNWLKSYRKAISPLSIRFFAVGEYGDNTNRPHYHVALFGVPACSNGRSRYVIRKGSSVVRNASCCPTCDLIRDTWGKGHVDVGSLTMKSAQYIAGYVTKKMTKADDVRLNGRVPEFSRQSNGGGRNAKTRLGGIGYSAMFDVANTLMALGLDVSEPDVPSALRYGEKKMLPLGRYLRRKLRLMVGKDEKTPQAILDEAAQEVRALLMDEEFLASGSSIKKGLFEKSEGEILKTEARERIYKQRRTV